MESNRRNLILASVFYLVSVGIGTTLALAEHLPARFGGILGGNDLVVDFLTLNGTALSPPLFMLVMQVAVTLLLFLQAGPERQRRRKWAPPAWPYWARATPSDS